MINVKALNLKNEKTKYLAFFLGTSLLAPTLYHSLGLSGVVYLPIFLSLSVGSFFLSPGYLLAIALFSPVLNNIFFGMPSGMMTYVLVFEGIIFSLANMRGKNIFVNIIISRISSLALIFFLSGYTYAIWSRNITLGIPGIFLNGILAIIMARTFKR
ncbi:MAG: hypothetical protein ACRDB7_09550 [Fusobacteriaceae bacterium]